VYDGDFESLRGIYSAMPTGDLDGDGDLDAFVPKSGSFGFPDIQFQYYVLFNDTFASDDAPMAWLRGDPDGSGVPDISDALFMLRHIFLGDRGPTCEAAGDVNGSMGMDFSDAIALLVHILLGGYQPAAPYPDFGDGALTSQPDLVLSCDEVDIFE